MVTLPFEGLKPEAREGRSLLQVQAFFPCEGGVCTNRHETQSFPRKIWPGAALGAATLPISPSLLDSWAGVWAGSFASSLYLLF